MVQNKCSHPTVLFGGPYLVGFFSFKVLGKFVLGVFLHSDFEISLWELPRYILGKEGLTHVVPSVFWSTLRLLAFGAWGVLKEPWNVENGV